METQKGLSGFVTEMPLFIDYWDLDAAPVPAPGKMKSRTPTPATRQEELDELLMFATRTCSEKCRMLLAAGASVNATARVSKRSAVCDAAKYGNVALMKLFFDDETLYAHKMSEKCIEFHWSDFGYGFAEILDIAIQFNTLDVVKKIIDK